MSFVGKSSQYYSGFSPTSIPGCALWLDALDSNSLTLSGSNVTAWRDKSGRGNNSTGIVNTPTLRANSINGYPAVFLSSNAVRGGISPTISSNQLHCFMVVTGLSTSGSYPRFLGLDDGVNAEYNSITGIEAIGRQGGANFVASRQNSGAIVNATDNVPHIVTSYVISSNQYITIDGSTNFSSASSSTTANFAISKWNLGCETSGSVGWNPQAYVGEVLVFSTALSSNLRYQVEGYLATKWGMKPNIPATHPFKTLPPFTRPFIPVDISGCALWLDGLDPSGSGVRPTYGSTVSAWVDKSGGSRNLAIGGFTAPAYGSNGLTFTGTAGLVLTAGLPSSYDMFVVGTPLASTASWRNLMQIISSTNHAILIEAGSIRMGRWYNTFSQFGSITWDASNAILFARMNADVTMNAAMNGTLALTAATTGAGTTSSGTINIGNDGSRAQAWGTISELVFYAGALTSQQRQQVETYLANKWGLRGSTPSTHLARLAPALSTVFLPPQTGGCSLWLDAADSTTIAFSSSTNVSTWSDKSGFSNNCSNQSVGTTITYPGTKVNGIDTINFTAGCIRGAFNGTSVINTTDVSIFIVTTHTAPNNNLRLFALTPAANYQDDQASQMLVYCSGNYQVTFYRGGAMPTAYTVTQNVPFLYTVTQTSGTGSMWFNGGSNTTAGITTSAFAVTNYNIGTQLLANQNYTGLVCEVIVYNTLLTTTQRQQVEGYLANKWKLTASLPSGHPYKAFKP